jgi:hypothetical protein
MPRRHVAVYEVDAVQPEAFSVLQAKAQPDQGDVLGWQIKWGPALVLYVRCRVICVESWHGGIWCLGGLVIRSPSGCKGS